MTTIEIKYLGNKVDTPNNGFFNALGKEALRNEFISKVQNKIGDIEDIEKVIEKIKIIEDKNNVVTSNTVFIIRIKSEKYYLLNNFKLFPKNDFERLNFVPYIKFDRTNCDISKEEKRINQILKYKNSDEAINFINDYIIELPKSFKQISHKPNQIYLYCNNYDKTFDLKSNVKVYN